jgi:hypothetical protein
MRSARIDFGRDGAVTGVTIMSDSDREEAMISGRLSEMFRPAAWRWINRLLAGGRLGGNTLKNAKRMK